MTELWCGVGVALAPLQGVTWARERALLLWWGWRMPSPPVVPRSDGECELLAAAHGADVGVVVGADEKSGISGGARRNCGAEVSMVALVTVTPPPARWRWIVGVREPVGV